VTGKVKYRQRDRSGDIQAERQVRRYTDIGTGKEIYRQAERQVREIYRQSDR
jgi:hypothetical protein